MHDRRSSYVPPAQPFGGEARELSRWWCGLNTAYKQQGEHMFDFFFFQAEDGIRDLTVTGVQTCALPISGVREAYNAVFVQAESAGRLMFYGAGAGGMPTASAVLGDVVAVARNRLAGTRGPDATSYPGPPVLPMGQALTRYHIALHVADRPGVLARVAASVARHEVSIKAVRQE